MLASSSNQSSRLHAALNRIGFYSSKQTEHSEALPLPPATVETLFQIHRCLITSIPYENLSVYFPPAWYVPGQVVAADGLPEPPIRVDIDSVFNKLVEQKRGGFCLELNTLYSWILTTLGYSVTTHLCKMVMGITEQDPAAHDIAKHIILLVTVPGTLERYCCDIGLSDLTALNPLGFYQGAEAPINAGRRALLVKGSWLGREGWFYQKGFSESAVNALYPEASDDEKLKLTAFENKGFFEEVEATKEEIAQVVRFVSQKHECPPGPNTFIVRSIQNQGGNSLAIGNLEVGIKFIRKDDKGVEVERVIVKGSDEGNVNVLVEFREMVKVWFETENF